MTTEEKLNKFLETSINDARKQSSDILMKYTAALEAELSDYKKSIDNQTEEKIKSETCKIKVLTNRELAHKQLELKRQISKKQEQLTDKLFIGVKNKLAAFMSTPAYHQLLIQQIKNALAFADNDEIAIYIDPDDESELSSLRNSIGIPISVSEYSFFGGTRAVIRSKNILIDNSFETKLKEIRENFTFDGGDL